MSVVVMGIECTVSQEDFPDGRKDVYAFTVPGWEECSIVGIRATKRVIRGRLDAAVRNTFGLDRDEGGELSR